MSEMFPVQYGVPKPAAVRARKGVQRTWPIDTMQVGGFFFVPSRSSKAVSAYISRLSKRFPDRKFSTMRIHAVKNDNEWHPWDTAKGPAPDGAVEGTGVWRDR